MNVNQELENTNDPALAVASDAMVPGHDADLARTAYLRDRQFHVFHAYANGLSVPVSVPDEGDNRQVVTDFLENTDSWDFEAETGKAVTDVVTSWWSPAGMYAGAGAARGGLRCR